MTTIICIILILFLFLSACFSGFESGIISIRKPRLDHAVEQKNKKATILDNFLKKPDEMLGVILLGNNICVVSATFFASELARRLGYAGSLQSVITAILVTIAILILAEILPKLWFRQSPFDRTIMLALPMYYFYLMTLPIVKVLTWFMKFIEKFFGKDEQKSAARVREDFLIMLHESESQGMISEISADLVEQSLKFHNLTVNDLMMKKEDVKTVHSSWTLKKAMKFSEASTTSRFPVIDDSAENAINDWLGIFSVYEAIYRYNQEDWPVIRVGDVCKDIKTISPEVNADEVLSHIQEARQPLLVVVNQDNNQIGIITSTDIVEPLFNLTEYETEKNKEKQLKSS